MRPVPIDDKFIGEDAKRIVIAPPGGDMTHPEIAPVEAMFVDGEGIMIRIAVEDADFESLRERPFVWLTLRTNQIPVFSIATESDRFEWEGGD